MGMFDYVRVECELPDGLPGPDHEFQTKDTPDCFVSTYTLTSDFRLLDPKGEEFGFHGDLCFYTGNVTFSGPHGYVTQDGDKAWSATYTALFDHGKMIRLEGSKEYHKDDPLRPLMTQKEWELVH